MRLEKGFHLVVRDCQEFMRDLPDEAVDVIVTSPPYNLDVAYGAYKDNLPEADYLRWSRSWLGEVFRVIKPSGSFFLNIAGSPNSPLLPHRIVLAATEDGCGFNLQNTFIWVKSIAVRERHDYTTYGHFKPLTSDRYVNDCHEYVFHLTKSGKVSIDRDSIGVPYVDPANKDRFQREANRRCRGNNWFIPYPTTTKGDQKLHPASFPVELPANCLKIHGCNADSVVLDPFLGIGKSALAAFQCGVGTFLGCDLDSDYVRVAKVALDRAREGLFAPEDFLPVPATSDQEAHPQLSLIGPENQEKGA